MRKKIDPTGYNTDKGVMPHYLRIYEEFFEPLLDKDVRILELGIDRGGSLLLWRDYFAKGTIVGIDVRPVQIDDSTGRIHVYQGYQQDIELLDIIAHKEAPEGFDVIIDDCSHIGELTRISFWHLFENHLKPGGIYSIEDFCTGYLDSWIDGASCKPSHYTVLNSLLYCTWLIVRSPMGKIGAVANRAIAGLSSSTAWISLRQHISPNIRESLNKRVSELQRFQCDIYIGGLTYKRRFPSHDYGMVGFIKELVDACSGQKVRIFNRIYPSSSKIDRIEVYHNIAIVVKAGACKKQE
jgi:hypothetical protein